MLDIPLLKRDLKDKAERISAKMDLLISQNPDPFPFERLEKCLKRRSLGHSLR